MVITQIYPLESSMIMMKSCFTVKLYRHNQHQANKKIERSNVKMNSYKDSWHETIM